MTVARSFADTGGAVVPVLHDLNLAAANADRIALLGRGPVVGVGSPWAVLRGDVLGAVFGHPVRVLRSRAATSRSVVPERIDSDDRNLDELETEPAPSPARRVATRRTTTQTA